ncbi:hypothetical protein BGX31_003217 [Mortierella sp. GBA43]|nr:hypothetical protein BGX31_003217 [Mortierella sp. GBA43]
MLSTTIGNTSHLAQDELAEQIVAITETLEVLRERAAIKFEQEREQRRLLQLQPPSSSKSNSGWGSISSSSMSKTHSHHQDQEIYILPPGTHPIVLAIWSTCTNETTLRNTLGRTLQELLVERRKHLRELELARERRRPVDEHAE